MAQFTEKINEFISLKKIAVTGVSSKQKDAANHVFNKFKAGNYNVFAINPRTDRVEGAKAYPNLTAINEKIDGVVIASPPASALSIIEECITLGIEWIWFHSSINQGSLENKAANFAEDNGINVIRTGCPLMYIKPVDFPHKCIKWVLNLTGKVPRK